MGEFSSIMQQILHFAYVLIISNLALNLHIDYQHKYTKAKFTRYSNLIYIYICAILYFIYTRNIRI